MKILVGMMSHETNTFSPVPTPLTRFGAGRNPLEGGVIQTTYRNRSSTMAGMLAEASQHDVELITPIAAAAPPSGPVDQDAYQYMCDRICEAAIGCDGLLLDLHGAMVTEQHEDGEGTLLARLRQEQPDIPIGVGLDMHANIFPEMVANASVITGYHTYPHIDMFETGVLSARVLLAALKGDVTPVMVWGNAPMLPHVMRQGTDDFPNKELQARAREMEETGEALTVSLFTGFPHADIYHAGLSVVVTTDNDPEKAAGNRPGPTGNHSSIRLNRWLSQLPEPPKLLMNLVTGLSSYWITTTTQPPAAPWIQPKCCARYWLATLMMWLLLASLTRTLCRK